MRASLRGMHISGAEGLFERNDINTAISNFLTRALKHPRGSPDEIVLTVEAIRRRPIEIEPLPLCTLRCNSNKNAQKYSADILRSHGVSEQALETAFGIITGPALRGASLVDIKTGRRLEPDKARGVRVSRLGIKKDILAGLTRRFKSLGLNAVTVREALVIASKVSSAPEIVAEICVSDDPDYTTGYIASKQIGYLRIPHIKRHGSKAGGRVFFIQSKSDIRKLIDYLERTPVIINSYPEIKAQANIDEVLSGLYR